MKIARICATAALFALQFAIVGCGSVGAASSNQANVSGTISPSSLSFGSVTVGTSSSKTILITNTGTANLVVSAINVTGPGFSVPGVTLPLTITAGNSYSGNVVFTPQVTGSAAGSVSVVSNLSGSPTVVSFTGTGVAATGNNLSVSPASLAFGSLTVGNSSSKNITLTNSGTAAVAVSAINVSGSGFATGTSTPFTVAASASTTVSVSFSPQAAAAANGSVSIVSNASNSPGSVSLSGTGVAASGNNLSVSPGLLSFGNVTVGASSSQTITLSNTGTVSVVVSAINVTGSGFGTSASVPFTVAVGASTTVTVSFSPQTAGGASGSVSIVSNASNSPGNVSLSGTGFTGAPPPSSKWVMGYYADWQAGLYPVNRIDFTALTHIALAHWLTNANGTLQTSSMETVAPSIIAPAHAAGVKAILMLGGSDDSNYPSAANASNRATLVSSILAKIDSLGMDGVDLDWEVNVNSTSLIALAQALRQARSTLIITVPIDPTVQPASLAAGLAAYCDQLNMMSYGNANYGNGWVSWYFSALAGDGSTHPDSVNLFTNNWLAAGVPSTKIGVGIGFYAVGWTAPVTGALQNTGSTTVPIGELAYGASSANGGGVLSWFYNQPGSNYVYDSGLPQQPSLSIPNGLTPSGWTGAPITWVTYEDEASIAAKAAYVNSNNLGGAIIWTLAEGATDPVTGRNPLLDAVKLGFLNNGPAPMPLLASSGAVNVAGATTIALTGLSSTLGQVNVSWWNGSSSVSWDNTTDSFTTYGQPSEYYIEASTNGTTWVQLTHITGEHYTGRQFVYDWSGKGYTQVRMRILSIVGSNAGQDSFTIHNAASNSTDAYLLLGDSITANCWAAANNTFPTEQFGAQIHATKSNRYPVSTEGGQSGFLSSTLLDTTAYGKPEIQQWLNDMPAVKYVGLSLGTNDASQGVASATYCANIQKLVQYIIAAGKTPIIPTIVASPDANVQANAPAMNACLATLESKYPSIVKGPDLWTLFAGHSVSDGWFFDNLHPSLGTGCTAFQNDWVNAITSEVYPQ